MRYTADTKLSLQLDQCYPAGSHPQTTRSQHTVRHVCRRLGQSHESKQRLIFCRTAEVLQYILTDGCFSTSRCLIFFLPLRVCSPWSCPWPWTLSMWTERQENIPSVNIRGPKLKLIKCYNTIGNKHRVRPVLGNIFSLLRYVLVHTSHSSTHLPTNHAAPLAYTNARPDDIFLLWLKFDYLSLSNLLWT